MSMRTTSLLIFLGALLVILALLPPDPNAHRSQTVEPAPSPDAAGVLVLDLQDDSSPAEVSAFAARHGLELVLSSPDSADEGLYRARVDNLRVADAAVTADPLVEAAEPVLQMQAHGLSVPNDPLWGKQWNMRRVGASAGWDVGAGRGVRVAVVDTGVSHVEDLRGTDLAAGRSFVPGVDAWEDDVGHGTHVAGTIAQTTNNKTGVAGIAPRATILPVKVLAASGGGDQDWVAAGIDWAVDHGADVINLSLGGPPSEIITNAVDKAADAGVIVVASAGNMGVRQVGHPAAHERAIGVSATGPTDARAPYSNYGPGIELSAPGGDLRKTDGGILQNARDPRTGEVGYVAFQGTSMAAPHVTGAVAVLLGRGLSADLAVDTLYASAKDLGKAGWDEEYGYGRLDIEAAVEHQMGWRDALLSFLAALIAMVLGRLGRLVLRKIVRLAVMTAFVTGLLAILAWVGIPSAGLTMGPLFWPAMIDPDWVHFPLWLSALIPAFFVFILGPTKGWWVAASLAIAWGASLIWGAGTGGLDPWWFDGAADVGWLVINGLLCILGAMAVVGLHGMISARPRGAAQRAGRA